MEPFDYPPLPPGKDAIRILNIEPGDFHDDPIVCTLTAVTFTSKPRYLALSYTWGDAFPHNQSLPTNKSMTSVPSDCQKSISWDGRIYATHQVYDQAALEAICKELKGNKDKVEPITINGQPFAIHHNLHLCLLHLRSKTAPLPLWVDAVCINQADADERNAQVALMSFIYSRAQAVVAWLGVRDIKPAQKRPKLFKRMAVESTVFGAPEFLQTLAQGQIPSCGDIDSKIAKKAAKSSYWTRLWILQEACLASQLVFLFGPRFWTFEQLSDWESNTDDLKYRSWPMVRMLNARRARHTDRMKLENLAEHFEGLACSELKDRIYGLVGLANDIRPFHFTNDRFRDPVEDHIVSLDMEAVSSSPTMPTGMGRLRVDYSAPFYDIWRDVLKVIYFRVTPLVDQVKYLAWAAPFRDQERRISVVRSAGIMQDILGREVAKELYRSLPVKVIPEKPCIRALGYAAAEILQIGPSYTSLISSADATYDWVDCWEDLYKSNQLGELRQVNETYLRRITNYTNDDLAQICPIKSYGTMARSAGANGGLDSSQYAQAFEAMWHAESSGEDTNPHICLCNNHMIALVPTMAKVGDIIVRFWNCSTAAVIRPAGNLEPSSFYTSGPALYLLVGKADISKHERREGTWVQPIHLPGDYPPAAGTPVTINVLDVDLDFRSLQMLSAPIGPGR